MIQDGRRSTDLIVEGVVQCCHHRLLVTHDTVLDLRLHLKNRQLTVEGEKQAIRLLVKEELAMHWKGK